MASTCLVTAKDYRRHWGAREVTVKGTAPVWSGPERRAGAADRRSGKHDRRWENCTGRRQRLADRRKTR